MRAFEGIDGRTVILASEAELSEAYDFAKELGNPSQFGKNGLRFLGSAVDNGRLTAALHQEGFSWKWIKASDLSAGQFSDELADVTLVALDNQLGVLLALKAMSEDLCYPEIESDTDVFGRFVPHWNTQENLSPLGWRLQQIWEAFPDAAARDTSELTFACAVEVFMQGAKWYTLEAKLLTQLAAHQKALAA
jgi:hypothetical protein